jgi:Uma2 family endonuclease
MAPVSITPTLTLEEFLSLPETKPGSEYLDGEVVQKSMPTTDHTIIQRLLSLVFGQFLRVHPIAEGGPEWRCIFGPAGQGWGRLPDFALVMRERLRGTRGDGPFFGAPDSAVEIMSPDDRISDVLDKVRFYLENGVRLVWLIDPGTRTVMVWFTWNEAHLFVEGDRLDCGDVLPGFSVLVSEILPPRELGAE